MILPVLLGYSGGQDSGLALFLLKFFHFNPLNNTPVQIFHANHSSSNYGFYTAFEAQKISTLLRTPFFNYLYIPEYKNREKICSYYNKKALNILNSQLWQKDWNQIIATEFCFENQKTSFIVNPIYHFMQENDARIWRYRCWQRASNYGNSCYCLSAHTATDRIETSLLNIFRGTSPQNLSGFDQLSYTRPFQWITRWESKTLCFLYKIPVHIDPSNRYYTKIDSRRNQIRQLILPLCNSIFYGTDIYSCKAYSFQQFLGQDQKYAKKIINYIYNYKSLHFLPSSIKRYCMFSLINEYLKS